MIIEKISLFKYNYIIKTVILNKTKHIVQYKLWKSLNGYSLNLDSIGVFKIWKVY
jgi:hypothetical protein